MHFVDGIPHTLAIHQGQLLPGLRFAVAVLDLGDDIVHVQIQL